MLSENTSNNLKHVTNTKKKKQKKSVGGQILFSRYLFQQVVRKQKGIK